MENNLKRTVSGSNLQMINLILRVARVFIAKFAPRNRTLLDGGRSISSDCTSVLSAIAVHMNRTTERAT